MWYAIVANGLERVTQDYNEIEQTKRLYTFPKFTKHATYESACEWIKRHHYSTPIKFIENYGSTVKRFTVKVSYKIGKNCVFYKIDTKDIGTVSLPTRNLPYLIESDGMIFRIKCEDMNLSNITISGHMSAIKRLLDIVGEFIDLNLELDNYCIFYCLTMYDKGKNADVANVRSRIHDRLGSVAFTYGMENIQV